MQVSYTDDGMEAIIFTAQGDMRQALNNLQSTYNGFNHVNAENVFKVCDEPHPLIVKDMLDDCIKGDVSKACSVKYKCLKIVIYVLIHIYIYYIRSIYLQVIFII